MKTWTPAAEGARLRDDADARTARAIPRSDARPLRSRQQAGLALPGEPAGGHGRIGGSFLTGVHVKPTEGADFEAGISIDQIAARELGQQTQLASLELSLDTTEFAGACDAGFSCAYTNTLCWRGPTTPLPMENDPRAVFERLFGDSGSTDRGGALSRLTAESQHPGFGDRASWRACSATSARATGRSWRSISTRFATSSAASRAPKNRARASCRSWSSRPARPTASRSTRKLMFDLQVLALQSDLTRVITFMMARSSARGPIRKSAWPIRTMRSRIIRTGPDNLEKIAKIGAYHSKPFAYYLERLQADAGRRRLAAGSHDRPVRPRHERFERPSADRPAACAVLAGLGGGQHLRRKGVPLTNLYTTLLGNLGVPVERIGDSTGTLSTL